MLEFPTALLVHRGQILLHQGCANLIDLITQKKYITDYTPSHAISMNNYLYIHDNSEINIIHNKKPKFIQQCSGFLVQFCENIYSVSFELEHVILKNLKGRINKFVFIAKKYQQYNSIFVVANEEQVLFFSLVSQKSKVVQCQDLNQIQELGPFGYQLQKQSIEQIFGEEEFQIQQKQMNDYLNQNKYYFDQNCKQVIKYIKGDKYNEQIEAPQIQTYLHDFQLTYVVKASSVFNIFYAFEDGYIHVFDHTKKILAQFPIDFNFYEGLKDDDDQFTLVHKAYSFKPILCAGKLYIQLFNKLLVLQKDKLVFISNIPQINSYINISEMHGCIFSLNGKLYSNNKSSNKLFVLENNQFVEIQQRIQQYSQVLQNNNNILVWNKNLDQISKLAPDFKLVKLLEAKFTSLRLNLNGICVFQNQNQLFCVDFNGKMSEIDEFEIVFGLNGLEPIMKFKGEIINIENNCEEQKVDGYILQFKQYLNLAEEQNQVKKQRVDLQLEKITQYVRQNKLMINVREQYQLIALKYSGIFDAEEIQ
ncbi:Conserved_hypothetical protein [Hexamita inflata]|uniref:Uncharacterized protein n=1 Tax=Hexamita inflata TaxID=28002 RepID=A0AA86TS25_9EUKA|nr:Conserved hypothetical protein [Hexamita inflata]